jgi:hypothetical protein
MRSFVTVLIVLAAVAFLMGSIHAFFGNFTFGIRFLAKDPETYWRGATGLILFAIALMMLQRLKA